MPKHCSLLLRCPECDKEWVSLAERYRDEYYGLCTDIDEEDCPECGAEGVVIDCDVDRYTWADRRYDNRIEERGWTE
jgi:hypothetical protein